MRIAVSGVNGFVGTHLVRELVAHGHDVVGLGKGPCTGEVAGLVADYVEGDLARDWPAAGAEDVGAVIHLAGLSAVGPSFGDPQSYLEGNSAPLTRLGERLLARPHRPRVVVVSTGAVYAPGVGLDERAPTATSSPYAVSKLLVEAQSSYYRGRGLDVVVARPFNHLGPGQQPGFILPDLVTGVAQGQVVAGDLDTRRDYTDVRDVARAYRLAVEAETLAVPVLNVCSGRSVSGRELLELVIARWGRVRPQVTVDADRLRPNDAREIRGDASLAARVLGWRPEITLDRTVQDTVAGLGAEGRPAC